MGGRRQRKVPWVEAAATDSPAFSPRFFITVAPSAEQVPGVRVVLEPEDAHHALKVLRLRPGDHCEVVTPARAVYEAAVSSAAIPFEVTLLSAVASERAGPVYRSEVGLVQALARPAVMDHLVEKGTEVGVDFFLVVPSAASPRHLAVGRQQRLERWKRIAREAAKQSKQTRVPQVEWRSSVEEVLTILRERQATAVVLDPRATRSLARLVGEAAASHTSAGGGASFALLIGPEGGWTEAESARFEEAGLARARLGRSILRTETAGPVAAAVTRLALDDW